MLKKIGRSYIKLQLDKGIAKFGNSSNDIYIFSLFWLLVAVLGFFQDYLNSTWNGSSFYAYESAAYKLFWLFFIPLTAVFHFAFARWMPENERTSKTKRLTVVLLISILISLVHLFVFALSLSGISQLIHDDPWRLSWLIKEKLSTRLYIALSVYAVLSYLALRSGKQKKLITPKPFNSVLPVKNGNKSVMVSADSIKWIKSDGAYLELHADDKKHVIINSLKNILDQLDPEQFRRIHKSTIVNLKMVSEIKSRLNGDYDILLKDGTELRLSRNYTKSLKGTLL